MKFWRKFFLYASLPEMRLFWALLPFLVVLSIINSYYLPSIWFVGSLVTLAFLAFIIFYNNLRVASSNIEVKVERNELQSIIFNLRDGVIAYDPHFKVVIFNRAAEGIFNLRADEVIGEVFNPSRAGEAHFKLLTQVFFPSLAPAVIQRGDQGTFPQIVDMSFADGNIELRVVTDKIIDPMNQLLGFVKVVHDRTREAELLRLKTEFIGIAAHQLRTPLSAVNWALENLNQSSLNAEQKEIVDAGTGAASKLLNTVNDLLDVSRIEDGRFGYKFENINIIDFVEETIKEMKSMAIESSVKIYFERPKESSIILFADPQKLKIALLNLLDNAVKYNVENGEIVVGIRKTPNEPFIEVSIKDTGVGIAPDEIDKVFRKFFRAENVVKMIPDGTGLGLYIVKNIIKRHGGDIRFESELNRGTTFYFTLPTDPKLIPPKEMVYGEE